MNVSLLQRLTRLALLLFVSLSTAHAATLEMPAQNKTHSGVGVIYGWKCDAGELTVRFDNGPALPLKHGISRADVRDDGACSHDYAGFVSLMNWGELGNGWHDAVVYDDGPRFSWPPMARAICATWRGEAPLR